MTADAIVNLALAFIFISLAIFIAGKLKFSSIPFLIVAGILVGPHAPEISGLSLSLVHPTESLELLSRLGVLLMLFYLGLEFSAGKLASSGPSLAKGGPVYVALNVARGLALGWLCFGAWTEALVVAGITGISSSAIITKLLLDLKRTANPETEFILGIMVLEDVFLAVYLSILSGVLLAGGNLQAMQIIPSILVILTIIAFVIACGRRIGTFLEPRLPAKSAESFVVAVFTLLLVTAVLVETIHIAEAIGALLLGLILAETIHAKQIVHIISPMRDLFGAVFFFTFGLGIDYKTFDTAAVLALIAVVITVIGNVLAGLLASWLAGYKAKRGFNVAFTVIARGEFAVIMASLAASAGANPVLPAFAALYVLVLAFISPVLAKNAPKFYQKYLRLAAMVSRRQDSSLNS